MRIAHMSCALLAVLGLGCSLDPFEPTVVGDRDAAVGRDAGGGAVDAGRRDAGSTDAGPGTDAGDRPDAGGELVDGGTDAGVDAGVDAGPVDACVVGTETCDGFDEDCDGNVDEDSDVACMNACGDPGTQRCVGGVLLACDAAGTAPETCNAMDDDCDGSIDEGGSCRCMVRQYGGHAYQFCTNQRRWSEARNECMRDGYDLVVIDDAAEDMFVSDTALMLRDIDWWIGLHDQAVEGVFRWVTGARPTYTNWAPGQPDGSGLLSDCAEISNGSAAGEVRARWDDDGCNDSAAYVCESP